MDFFLSHPLIDFFCGISRPGTPIEVKKQQHDSLGENALAFWEDGHLLVWTPAPAAAAADDDDQGSIDARKRRGVGLGGDGSTGGARGGDADKE